MSSHPAQARGVPSYANPHHGVRGVNGAEITTRLSPPSLWVLCAGQQLVAASLGQSFGVSGPSGTAAQCPPRDSSAKMVLAVGKWHQPPGMGKATARGMSVPEVLPREKEICLGKDETFHYALPPPDSFHSTASLGLQPPFSFPVNLSDSPTIYYCRASSLKARQSDGKRSELRWI